MDEIKKQIDVIIPRYNVEETIEDCIKSLCNQSLSKNEYSCYFINDCSKDSTGSILDKYKSIENISVFHHKENQGLAMTRNEGIKAGESKMIAFLDGDMVVKKKLAGIFFALFQ